MLKRQLGKEVILKEVKHGEKAEVRQIMQQIEGYNCDSLQTMCKTCWRYRVWSCISVSGTRDLIKTELRMLVFQSNNGVFY